jgi:hypothetical protein
MKRWNGLIVSFKRLILLSALTVLLGVSLVYAVSYTFKPKNSAQTLTTAEAVDEQDGLELNMTLEKTEYSLGEPINITLTITNISNQTINLTVGDPFFDFRVYNDTNSDLYEWSWSQISLNIEWSPLPLGAEESLTNRLVWPQTWNDMVFSEGVSVSPGTYYIVGLVFDLPHGLETTPIQVTIVKP